ncbi:MAG: hypothetical protein WCI17_07325, partial [bacterium]
MDASLLAELRHRAVDADLSLAAWITQTLVSIASHRAPDSRGDNALPWRLGPSNRVGTNKTG